MNKAFTYYVTYKKINHLYDKHDFFYIGSNTKFF